MNDRARGMIESGAAQRAEHFARIEKLEDIVMLQQETIEVLVQSSEEALELFKKLSKLEDITRDRQDIISERLSLLTQRLNDHENLA